MTPDYAEDVSEKLSGASTTLGQLLRQLTQIALRLDQDHADGVAELLQTIRDARNCAFVGSAQAERIAEKLRKTSEAQRAPASSSSPVAGAIRVRRAKAPSATNKRRRST